MWIIKYLFFFVCCIDIVFDCWELDMVIFVYCVYYVIVIVCIICYSYCVLYMFEFLMYGEEIYVMW